MRNSIVEEIGDLDVMTHPIMGRYAIYVDGDRMSKNIANREYEPVLVVRETSSGDTMVVRDLYWDAPTRFVFREIKLPDTDVQGWIETDGPLIACRDEEPFVVIGGCRADVTDPDMGFVVPRHVIHLDVPTLRRNRASGQDAPVIAIRHPKDGLALSSATFCREAAWFGRSRIIHRPTVFIPNTNGRGSAFVETEAEDITAIMIDGLPRVISGLKT